MRHDERRTPHAPLSRRPPSFCFAQRSRHESGPPPRSPRLRQPLPPSRRAARACALRQRRGWARAAVLGKRCECASWGPTVRDQRRRRRHRLRNVLRRDATLTRLRGPTKWRVPVSWPLAQALSPCRTRLERTRAAADARMALVQVRRTPRLLLKLFAAAITASVCAYAWRRVSLNALHRAEEHSRALPLLSARAPVSLHSYVLSVSNARDCAFTQHRVRRLRSLCPFGCWARQLRTCVCAVSGTCSTSLASGLMMTRLAPLTQWQPGRRPAAGAAVPPVLGCWSKAAAHCC